MEEKKDIFYSVTSALFLTASLFAVAAFFIYGFSSESADYVALVDQVKKMDIANFSKIEVMSKQIATMFPKIVEVENQVLDLHNTLVDRYAAQGRVGGSPSTERISFEEMCNHLYTVDKDK